MTDLFRITLEENLIAVRFPYEPRLVDVVRSIPGREWNKKIKRAWSIPVTPWHCAKVIEVFAPYSGFDIDPKIKQLANTKAEKPNLYKKLPKNLYSFQKEAVEFIYTARGRALIGDAPGVGKTAPSLVFVAMFGGEKTLIVAPANVTYKWAEKEAPTWAKHLTVQVVEGGKKPMLDTNITIMSYRTMVMRYEELSQLPFDTIIFDEAHYLKSNASQQNRVARKLVRGVPSLLMLTGTPYKNRRFELFQLLHMLDPHQWNNAIDFGTRYCGGVFSQGMWFKPPDGETNTEELQERLASIMIRRTKHQVLKALPELTRVPTPININMIDYRKTLMQIRKEAKTKAYSPAFALTLMNKLRQVVGRGKVAAALELAVDLIAADEKVVIHAHHREVVRAIVEGLLRAGIKSQEIGVIDGSTPSNVRYNLQEYFLSAHGSLKVMVISSAGREGIDLYSASHIIFVERQWTPADEEQLEARLYRNGQRNAVTAHYLVAKGTIDERLDQIVRRKRTEFENLIESDIIKEIFAKEVLEHEG